MDAYAAGKIDAVTVTNSDALVTGVGGAKSVIIMLTDYSDLDVAIFLADRILVLKAHPGEVLEFIGAPAPRPRHPEQSASEEFLATKARLEEWIHPPVQVSEEDEVKPHMIRFTNVVDNVE